VVTPFCDAACFVASNPAKAKSTFTCHCPHSAKTEKGKSAPAHDRHSPCCPEITAAPAAVESASSVAATLQSSPHTWTAYAVLLHQHELAPAFHSQVVRYRSWRCKSWPVLLAATRSGRAPPVAC
jgi:hypothetical protein